MVKLGGKVPDLRPMSCRVVTGARLLVVVAVLSGGLASSATAEQASDPSSPAAGRISTGAYDTCAVLQDGSLRCWGLNYNGELGYGNTSNVGDVNNTPATVGPVNLGGRKVTAVAAGSYHTCAILDDGSVRCWGLGGNGRLGYGNTDQVLDPSAVGGVNLGTDSATGQPYTATAISAGSDNTCVILNTGGVECWGFGGDGENGGALGYNATNDLGGTPATTPDQNGTVDLGTDSSTSQPYTATAISTSGGHTCALLNDGSVECWGALTDGQLGYGTMTNYGESPTATVADAGPVPLGAGAVALTTATDLATTTGFTGDAGHTCAILVGGSVECWGDNDDGQLGYNNPGTDVGSITTLLPSTEGPVSLGTGNTATAISAGGSDTCAILQDGTVRCWGMGTYGRLGYPTLDSSGTQADIDAPPSVPVDLGPGRTAIAISAGGEHTCALLDNQTVRCWGYGAYGQLGYCSEANVGETNTPGSVGPVNLQPGDGGTTCPPPVGGTTTPPATTTTPATTTPPSYPIKPPDTGLQQALRAQRARAKAFRNCVHQARRRPKRKRALAVAQCIRRYERTPGRVGRLSARTLSRTAIVLSFTAPGTDGRHPPAATSYLIAQTRRPVHTARAFRAAPVLCSGHCEFSVKAVGTVLKLTITHLRPGTRYYYAVAALDNVTARSGPQSAAIAVRTR